MARECGLVCVRIVDGHFPGPDVGVEVGEDLGFAKWVYIVIHAGQWIVDSIDPSVIDTDLPGLIRFR